MTALTAEGRARVAEIAERHGVSAETAETLLLALVAGGGTQAQFNLPELGGMGQWSQGGMTMVGDMFNNALKAKVDALCGDLAQLLASHQLLSPTPGPVSRQSQSQSSGASGSSLFIAGGAGGSQSWPAELGAPSSVGTQNNLRYAVFPQTHRLAIDVAGRLEVYDTGDHQISGVSQQQSGDQSLTFTSQYGLVRVADLPKVSLEPDARAAKTEVAEPKPEPTPEETPSPEPDRAADPVSPPVAAEKPAAPQGDADADAIIGLIRKLADLKDSGILTDAEFEAKKSELLSRL